MKGFEGMDEMKIDHRHSRTRGANACAGRAVAPLPPRGRGTRPACPQWLVAICAFFAFTLTAPAADPTISISARQRYPWNGLVDLDFTITGTSGTKYDTSFTAKDIVGNTNITMATVRKADGSAANVAKEQLTPGSYLWVWDAAADLPDGFECDRVTVTGTADIDAFPYSVKFNANGGSGSMANEPFTYGTAKALIANAFTRTDYTFQGWATSANGAKVYNDKQLVSNLADTSGAVVNLYAVWKLARGKVQLWQGGPYWADRNIGAGEPWEYGYYFWWGDTVGCQWNGETWVTSDGSSSNFSFISGNSQTYNKSIGTLKSEGWIAGNNVLVSEHDAACVKWGSGWRMPTREELDDLSSKCDWIWTTTNSVSGYIVRGRGNYVSNSIFIPASGYVDETSLVYSGSIGHYWSSTACSPSAGYTTYGLYFRSDYHNLGAYNRFSGRPVRPVQ